MALTLTEAYRILELDHGASTDEVRLAYKRLALKFHPDKNRNGIDTTEMFQRVSAAYKRITDPTSNQEDTYNQNDFNDAFPFEDMMHLFDMMFSKPSQRMSSSKSKKKTNSRMNFEDILFGSMDFDDTEDEFDEFDEFDTKMDPFMYASLFGMNDEENELNDFLESMAGLTMKGDKLKSRRTSSRTNYGRKGHRKPIHIAKQKAERKENDSLREDIFKIGSKVKVYKKHEGIIAYIGHVHYTKVEMIGIILNEPIGKNNGKIKGIEYFKCDLNHGLMVQRQDITINHLSTHIHFDGV